MTWTPLSRSKGQDHQAVLLSAALTHKASAAVSVGMYSAWESTATLRRNRARCFGAHGGGKGRGHIVSPCAELVDIVSCSDLLHIYYIPQYLTVLILTKWFSTCNENCNACSFSSSGFIVGVLE